jgi:hypothetical protein
LKANKKKEKSQKKNKRETQANVERKKAARANWNHQAVTDNVAVMCSKAWASTYQKPMKYSHRAKRRKDRVKKSEKFLNRIDGSQLSQHAVDRSVERHITAIDIMKTLKNGTAYQQSDNSFKVVSKGKKHITVVISKKRNGLMEKRQETTKKRPFVVDVITVYKNYK